MVKTSAPADEQHQQWQWLRAYHQAALEVDAREMPAQIEAARRSISGRLQAIEGDSDHHAERAQIAAALAVLAAIDKESRNWPL